MNGFQRKLDIRTGGLGCTGRVGKRDFGRVGSAYVFPEHTTKSCVKAYGLAWRDRCAALEAAQQVMATAQTAYQDRFLRSPFVGWRATAHGMRRRADLLQLCVGRMRHRAAALAFQRWRSVAAELRRQRTVVEGSLRRLFHRSGDACSQLITTIALDESLVAAGHSEASWEPQ